MLCSDFSNKDDSSFTIGDSAYQLIQNPSSQTTRDFARSDCQSRNGDLLTIKDEATQNKLLEILDNISDSHTILLGLKKEAGQWKWVDGKSMKILASYYTRSMP